MRVGLDVHVLGGSAQGTVSVWSNLIPSLPQEHEYILYSFDPAETRRRFPGAHLQHRRIPVHQPYLRIQAAYPLLARLHGCQVFHANYYGPLVGAPGLVLSVHDVIYLDFPEFAPQRRRQAMKILGRLSARAARVVVAGSEYSRGRILKHFRLPEDRVVVVHYGLGDEWHRPDEAAIQRAWEKLRARVPQRYLLTVGRLDARKNFPACAKVARALTEEGLLDGLVIVGPADFGATVIEEALRRDGTERLVTRFADLSLAEIQALYRGARGLLYLSLAEGFGLPLIEAMALGTPVVSSDRTAMPEVCHGAALLVDPAELRGVTEATRRIVNDDATRARLVAAGRVRAMAFRSRATGEAMAKVYAAAAGRC